jgi:hypothetical protein
MRELSSHIGSCVQKCRSDQLLCAPHTELLTNLAGMSPDRLITNAQPQRDLGIGSPETQMTKNLKLTRSQLGCHLDSSSLDSRAIRRYEDERTARQKPNCSEEIRRRRATIYTRNASRQQHRPQQPRRLVRYHEQPRGRSFRLQAHEQRVLYTVSHDQNLRRLTRKSLLESMAPQTRREDIELRHKKRRHPTTQVRPEIPQGDANSATPRVVTARCPSPSRSAHRGPPRASTTTTPRRACS